MTPGADETKVFLYDKGPKENDNEIQLTGRNV